MKQIGNYFSRIKHSQVNTVLLLTDRQEFQGLLQCIRPTHVYRSFDELTLEDQLIDMLLFDSESACMLEQLEAMPKRYLVGCMALTQDYYSLWEANRKNTEHMYIELLNESTGSREIFEWDAADGDVELSVILPVYNVSGYLPQCIDSLTKWQASYVEYLFVDDGSTDDSVAIIQSYMAKDSRIRLLQKQNGGCASARNLGIENARGRYIGFVDSDDFVDEAMFPKLLKRAMLGNYDLTYCGYQAYYEESGEAEPILDDCLTGAYLTGEYNTDKIQLLAVNTRVAIWRCLYKKVVLEEHRIRFHEDLRRFDDLPFRVEYTFAAKSAICIPEYLYYYRIGRKGQDTECTDERLYVHFDIFRHLDQYVTGFKDRRMWDILQAVKIQTHVYGVNTIALKYKKRYAQKAKEQLKEHAGYWRNICIIFLYAGRGNLSRFHRLWVWRK